MPSAHLPNYLRTYRKRTGLSQDEMAYLLGAKSGGAKVSRYERFRRQPSLETALVYEVLLDTPVRELFRGLSDDAEREAHRRARRLLRRLAARSGNPALARKLAALGIVVDKTASDVRYEPLTLP